MRHISLLAVSLLALAACTPEKQQEADDYTQYVNPFIGTDFTGNTYPGAQVPFGMVQLSPDNGLPGWDRISGYFYPDTTIAGFSHTHLSGTGAGDLYDISFMPVTRPYKEAPAPLGVYSTFSHNDEMASAGYYRVLLKDYNINVELTATERCGIQRYTFPKAEASVFLNLKKAMNWDFTLDSYIEVVDSMTIRGYRFSQGWSPLQHVYFETRFSKPFMACHMDTTSIVTKDRGRIGTAYIARFDFNTEKDEEILVTTGISGVSMEGAGKNLRAEVSKDDFDYYQAQAAKTWNKQLSKIEVKSSDTDDLVKFYTALYHSMIAPTIYSDVDGSYYGPDQQIHKADGWTNYSTFSLWDTYRASHPLFTYTEPKRANDMIKGFLKFYEQNGALPLWNLYGWETNMMIGYHAVPVIVDAYLKGIGNFDPEKALEACIATANRDDYRGIGDYKKLGYVPAYGDPKKWENWSLSKTLEYAYDDYCIATMAKKMGKTRIIAETGAGQHGVATATVCALMNMECIVYMGKTDVERQRVNVEKMKMLGATVVPVTSGNMTLKDATNEAIRDWCCHPSDTYYVIGSTVGPHPYPDMVARLQSVISEEIRKQLLEHEGRECPDYLIACVGGGSNAAGTIYHYVNDPHVQIVLAEAGGKGIETGMTAATIALGKMGIIHGSRTYVIQNEDGQIEEPYSISAGLDYPGIGPMHANLAKQKRAIVLAVNDDEAIRAAYELTRLEGIIPALESAHALGALEKMRFKPTDVVVLTVSGRGDKDIETYLSDEL